MVSLDRVEFVVADAFEYLRGRVKGIEERMERGKLTSGKTAGKAKPDTSKPMTSDAGGSGMLLFLIRQHLPSQKAPSKARPVIKTLTCMG